MPGQISCTQQQRADELVPNLTCLVMPTATEGSAQDKIQRLRPYWQTKVMLSRQRCDDHMALRATTTSRFSGVSTKVIALRFSACQVSQYAPPTQDTTFVTALRIFSAPAKHEHKHGEWLTAPKALILDLAGCQKLGGVWLLNSAITTKYQKSAPRLFELSSFRS